MGCDIHVYPEYELRHDDDVSHWAPLANRMSPGRYYRLFGKIAGVRCDGQMIEQRGLPADVGYSAKSDNELYIIDGDTDSEGCCTRAQAEQWVQYRSRYTDDRKVSVTHPDWHSHSWCSPQELRAVLESLPDEPVTYWALLAMLEEVERRGKRARIVFWFDN